MRAFIIIASINKELFVLLVCEVAVIDAFNLHYQNGHSISAKTMATRCSPKGFLVRKKSKIRIS